MASNGYKLRDRKGWKGGNIAIYSRKRIECEKLSLRNNHEQVKSLLVESETEAAKVAL